MIDHRPSKARGPTVVREVAWPHSSDGGCGARPVLGATSVLAGNIILFFCVRSASNLLRLTASASEPMLGSSQAVTGATLVTGLRAAVATELP